MKILAVETSCDETAVAIVECLGGARAPKFRILSNVVASQINVHAPFGGVVPNLAKREHEKNLPVVLTRALKEAGLLISNFQNSKFQVPSSVPNVDAIAVTVGPGLAPALWTGVNFAKELATQWGKPLIAVNHMEGHIASVLLNDPEMSLLRRYAPRNDKKIIFPALALLVSGGHTELVLMKNWRDKKVIGETLDDAAGEAFDKVARLLGLPYPGGPALAKEASTLDKKSSITNDKQSQNALSNIKLPRPMIHTKDFNFSFSGLKTAVLYLVEKLKKEGVSIKTMRPLIAKEFQDAVVDVLVAKTMRAAKEYDVKTIILGGGVAANNLLRRVLGIEISKQFHDTCYLLPATQFTGDNAAMIAAAAFLFNTKRKTPLHKIAADANMRL